MSTERDDGLTADDELTAAGGLAKDTGLTGNGDLTGEQVRERLRRRAVFLRELAEARELRRRVAPRRSRRAQVHAVLRMNTFRTG